MTLKNTAAASRETSQSEQLDLALNLDHRYGNIGISAVAAAVRYHGKGNNLAYAPVAPQGDERS
jgi:hypothetical protein